MNHALIINLSDSKCGNCGKNANLHDKTHDWTYGYQPGPGCGVRWVFMTSDYAGQDIKNACLRLRPDLVWEERSWINE